MHTHQSLVTPAQVVPAAPAALPRQLGTGGAAAAHPRGDAPRARELEGALGGAVDPLAGRAVQSL